MLRQKKQTSNLFVYGSLMFDRVWKSLLPGWRRRVDARLDDFRCLRVSGELFPGLKRGRGGVVKGKLVFGLGQRDLLILDRFEGVLYQRQTVSVTTVDGGTHQADVYVIHPRFHHRLSDREWCEETFRDEHLDDFLSMLR